MPIPLREPLLNDLLTQPLHHLKPAIRAIPNLFLHLTQLKLLLDQPVQINYLFDPLVPTPPTKELANPLEITFVNQVLLDKKLDLRH